MAATNRRAIFLDRDGVINRMVYDADHGLVDSPSNADQFVLLPGAAEAVRLINQMGFLAIVVSNQPGIAKGKLSQEMLSAITRKMHDEMAKVGARLDAVYYCLHHPEAIQEEFRVHCDCRKPSPGLLKRAITDLAISPAESYMIGDGLTDVLAGRSAGCRTVLIGRHKCDLCALMDDLGAKPDSIEPSLFRAIQAIKQAEE